MEVQESILEYSKKDKDSIIFKLKTHEKRGLSETEVHQKREQFGTNELSESHEFNIVTEFFSHFLEPLNLILFFAAVLSISLGEKTNALIIFAIVLIGVVLDFVQEYGADKSLKNLLEKVKNTATVIRDNRKTEINFHEIVVGDILILETGDLIPADARVISTLDFFVNQSAITGESFPSEKTSDVLTTITSPADCHNLIFRGTNVVNGCATAVVIKTGKNTEFGKIAKTLSEKPLKSDFEIGATHFGYFLMKIILFLVVIIFFLNSFLKHDYFESFMFAIAIAVGITPELLPMIMTITMSSGSKKMAKKGVIVKKLSAIPSFGSMSILCTDKTGTLTDNKIALVKHTDYKGIDNETVLLYSYLNSSYQTGLKNPLDEAVLQYEKISISSYKKLGEIPYDFFRKRMSVVVKNKSEITLITKGAPEEVLENCIYYKEKNKTVKITPKIKKEIFDTYKKLSEDGFRVIAVSTKTLKETEKKYTKADETQLIFEGFIGFLDPAKHGVKQAIAELEELGVAIKIITGDNEYVTRKICSDVGLEVKSLLLGHELEKLTDDALKVKALQTSVFARCSPDQKNRIIIALKATGAVVGYMGDGINDAPSLRTADVGISVNNAVDVAKESAEIVLTHKELSVLKEGIIDGRKTFGNTMKYIMMTLSSNFENMFSAIGAIIMLPFLPMLPVQILLNNFIYDFSQISISTDTVDEEWIKKPKKWDLNFIKKFMFIFGPISSIFDILTFIIMFYVLNANAALFQTAWFMESLATQLLVIHVIRTKKIPLIQSKANLPLLLSTIIFLTIGWLIPYTELGAIFGFAPLPMSMILIIIGIVIVYLITVELVKRRFYKTHDF